MDTGAPLVRVLGLGNVLMGDDAFGPWVIHLLEATYAFPPEVEVVDVGTPGLDLIPYIAGGSGIILVDTVHSKDAMPGTIKLYDRDALVKFGPKPRLSPHDPGVTEAILGAEMAGQGPSFVRLVGVVPESVKAGVGLTPALQDAVSRAADEIVVELVARGFEMRRLSPGAVSVPLPWWETPVIAVPPAPLPVPEEEPVLV
jgi:hydrogenase maturation protease